MILVLAAVAVSAGLVSSLEPEAFVCSEPSSPNSLLIVASKSGFPLKQTGNTITIDKSGSLEGQKFETYNWISESDGTQILYLFGPKDVNDRQVLALAKHTDSSGFYVGRKINFSKPSEKPIRYTCKLVAGADALKIVSAESTLTSQESK